MDFKIFWGLISRLLVVKQTLFALPFAFIGVLFADTKAPVSIAACIWVALALVSARSAGMFFNQVIDAAIDKKNPRTADRVVPSGLLRPSTVWIMALVSCLILIFSSWMLNPLCFKLSFLAVFLLLTYSYFKRFSASSHYYLGVVEAAAPIGGYIAVTGQFDIVPFILGSIILFWIAGLDILYAFQDIEFDRKENLHSIPAKMGKKNARYLSIISYGLSALAMITAGILTSRGVLFWAGTAAIILIFSYQQMLATHKNMEAVIGKIFKANMMISPMLLIGTFLDHLQHFS